MYFLTAISYLFFVLTFLPLIRDKYWLFRILEYPRFQKLIIVSVSLGGWAIYFALTGKISILPALLLATCEIYLIVKIFPYTFLAQKEVKGPSGGASIADIKILAANIYQPNMLYEVFLDQVRETDPDIVFLLEADKKWKNALHELEISHPYCLFEPLNNTYGLLFYSRLKLRDGSVRYLVKNDVPSVNAQVQLASGDIIQIYGLHPEPPVPGESLRSTAKDKELMKVALAVRENPMPCIVVGDLNDVAWSYTTSLFTKVSGLLDVRKGRGFYSTFSANHWWMRFPLDYIFCSSDFRLRSMRRMPYNGSDHFAMFTHLVYEPHKKEKQEKSDAGTLSDVNKAGKEAAADPG